jgi:hypothetical protein
MAHSFGIELSPQIWNWYVGFFISMGAILSVAIAFTFAVLLIHWLYLCARNIASEPTPLSLHRALFRLSAFQAIVLGAVLVLVGTIAIYYLFFSLIWQLAPRMIDVPPLDFGSISEEKRLVGSASLLIYLVALSILIATAIFFLLRYRANRINQEKGSIGFFKKFLVRYFHESIFVGFLLILIACPILLYFLYNVALLTLIIVPATRHELPKIAFQNADHVYMRGLGFISSWLIVLLSLPAIGLLFRALLLRWRYTIENPFLHIIFLRHLKFSMIGLLGMLGCVAMYYLADSFIRIILRVSY